MTVVLAPITIAKCVSPPCCSCLIFIKCQLYAQFGLFSSCYIISVVYFQLLWTVTYWFTSVVCSHSSSILSHVRQEFLFINTHKSIMYKRIHNKSQKGFMYHTHTNIRISGIFLIFCIRNICEFNFYHVVNCWNQAHHSKIYVFNFHPFATGKTLNSEN